MNVEVLNERLEKYYQKIQEKPRNKNQLLVKDGRGFLVLRGEMEECKVIEGYLRLSEKDAIRPIAQENIALYILPKEKMIIRQEDNRCEFLGYKSENTEGCIMAIHAVTEHDDLVIVHIDDSIPIFISLDEYYDEVDNGNARIYQVVDCLLRKQLPDINTNINNAKVVEEDEWE